MSDYENYKVKLKSDCRKLDYSHCRDADHRENCNWRGPNKPGSTVKRKASCTSRSGKATKFITKEQYDEYRNLAKTNDPNTEIPEIYGISRNRNGRQRYHPIQLKQNNNDGGEIKQENTQKTLRRQIKENTEFCKAESLHNLMCLNSLWAEDNNCVNYCSTLSPLELSDYFWRLVDLAVRQTQDKNSGYTTELKTLSTTDLKRLVKLWMDIIDDTRATIIATVKARTPNATIDLSNKTVKLFYDNAAKEILSRGSIFFDNFNKNPQESINQLRDEIKSGKTKKIQNYDDNFFIDPINNELKNRNLDQSNGGSNLGEEDRYSFNNKRENFKSLSSEIKRIVDPKLTITQENMAWLNKFKNLVFELWRFTSTRERQAAWDNLQDLISKEISKTRNLENASLALVQDEILNIITNLDHIYPQSPSRKILTLGDILNEVN